MDFRDINELKIYKKNNYCGRLVRRSDGGADFFYDKNYLENLSLPPICFHMPKRAEPYVQHGVNLHPYFAGLLPEGLRLQVLVQKTKTSPDDLFSLFATIGNECIGDVYPQLDDSANTVSSEPLPRWNEINFYDFFLTSMQSAKLQKNSSDFAGVQEKISASMISLPLSLKGQGPSILKLNPKDKPQLVYNEWASLTLAQLCGLEVNNFNLIEDKTGQQGLLVQRFDRQNHFDRDLFLHQEDLCQALNLFPAEKYRIPLKDIYLAIQRWSTSPQVEIYKLSKLIVFSYLIGNGDLHAKNISLRENPLTGQMELSPAYDLICTLIYGDQKMALKMDAKDAQFKRSDFIKFISRFDLTSKAIESLIDDILKYFFLHHHILFSIPAPDHRMNFLTNELQQRMSELS